jgi:AcrR family transcriptional regulator
MKSLPDEDGPAVGLRERKKAKTRAAIQQHALRLFQEQGYAATTVEQIAAAAEVSPSTFFRYFPTKEDVVLYDALDPVLIAAFRAQPAELSPIQAMRAAFRAAASSVQAEALLAHQRERAMLILQEPELRMRMLDDLRGTLQVFVELVAERVGRRADDFAVRAFTGAVVGVMLAAWLPAVTDPTVDLLALVDDSLAYLEAGLPW